MALPLVGALALIVLSGWLALRHQWNQRPDDDLSTGYRIGVENGQVVTRDAKTHERLVTCPDCGGKGKHKDGLREDTWCGGCGGSGMITERAALLRGKKTPPSWQVGW